MGHQIIRQPNGFYGLWSTVVGNFLVMNATAEDIAILEAEEARKESMRSTKTMIENEDVRVRNFITFDEAIKLILRDHGKVEADLALQEGGCPDVKHVPAIREYQDSLLSIIFLTITIGLLLASAGFLIMMNVFSLGFAFAAAGIVLAHKGDKKYQELLDKYRGKSNEG